MSLTPSQMMPIGTEAPSFQLINVIDQKSYSFNNLKGKKGLLVMFICNHCPYVIHVIKELVSISKEYERMGIKSVAISSNDIQKYPDDSPEKMVQFAKDYEFNFPYLFDETQDIAKAYDAACTPDLYLFDQNDKCYYRGRLDEARPGNDIPVDGKDLRNALNELLNGNKPPKDQYPSAGCNIKWK